MMMTTTDPQMMRPRRLRWSSLRNTFWLNTPSAPFLVRLRLVHRHEQVLQAGIRHPQIRQVKPCQAIDDLVDRGLDRQLEVSRPSLNLDRLGPSGEVVADGCPVPRPPEGDNLHLPAGQLADRRDLDQPPLLYDAH